jgi:outer membrane protein OmpA-like peptidoglycan-associated protein
MSNRIIVSCLSTLAFAIALLGSAPSPAEAQFGKRLKDAVKRTAEDKAIQKATEEESKAIDNAVEGGADAEAAPGEAAPAEAAAPATPAAAPTEAAAPAAPAAEAGAAAAPAASVKPGEGAWANFDFKPGERVLFLEDFSKDEVGNFPARLELKRGNAEVVEWQGRRLLSIPAASIIEIPLPETLPERFTVEFEYFAGQAANYGAQPMLLFAEEPNLDSPRNPHVQFATTAGIAGPQEFTTAIAHEYRDSLYKVRVMADGKYAKVYINERRVANAPSANLARPNKLILNVRGWDKQPSLIGNIHVAAGGKKLYDALAEKGRVATQGIYFDTGSDRLRPESSATLKEIGTMLKEHPELKLTIEGHTDNVGSAESNQTLSEKRAASVRQFLIDSYQIDGGRLAAKGLGQTKPMGPNDTPEGRQNNRRVELVKQ